MTKTNHYLKVLAALVTLAALTALTMAMAADPADAKKKKKGPAKVAFALNADKVDNKSAEELLRVAFQKHNDSNIGADGTAATTTINAPAPGFLVIDASSNVFNNQQNDELVQCLIEVDNRVDDPSRRFMQLSKDINEEEDCSTNTVVPVDKGNHTIDLEALDVGTGTNFDQTTLSAMYVPFDGQGAPAVP